MSLRQIILVRHAHAEPAASGQADFDRALSERGRQEADDAQRHLGAMPPPARVVSSPARRARDTAAMVFAGQSIAHDERIYEATPGTLLQVIEDNADVERLALVGHNPGFEEVAALLSSGQSGDHRGLPPAGVVVLELADGAAPEPGSATLREFWSPA